MTDLKKFATIGTTKIEEQTGDFQKQVLSVFKAYPERFYPQNDFVTAVGKSNPFVNKTLRKLEETKVVTRVRTGNKFFYKLAK